MSVTSTTASTLDVEWSSTTGATSYKLELKAVNYTVAPVVLMPAPPETQRLVHGLRPGSNYQVTLTAFQFMSILCTAVETALTGKDSAIKSNQVNTTGESLC